MSLVAIFCGLFLFLTSKTQAQEIEVNVNIVVEQLSEEARRYVSTMKYDIEDYVNNQSFTDTDWEGPKIPVDISIYLSGGYNNVYSGRFLVTAQRRLFGDDAKMVTLQLMDNKWSFEYTTGASLTYNTRRFDKFTSLIDYYMLLVIGFDMDTYSDLGGTSVYNKAKEIVLLGNSQSADGYEINSMPGDITKFGMVSELLDPRYEGLRTLFLEFYADAFDQMTTKKTEAIRILTEVIADIAYFKKHNIVRSCAIIGLFFRTKAEALSKIFEKHPDRAKVMKNLRYINPENSEIYTDQ